MLIAAALSLPLVVPMLLVGCGAKTGLDVPDAPIDAAVDVELDVGDPAVVRLAQTSGGEAAAGEKHEGKDAEPNRGRPG